LLGDEQSLVDQSVSVSRHVGGEDPNLAILDFSDGSAVLSANADRVLALFDEATFVEDQGTLRAAEIIVNKTTILGYHVVFVPRSIADKTLQSSDIATFHGQGDGFNGFTFQRAELSGHVF